MIFAVFGLLGCGARTTPGPGLLEDSFRTEEIDIEHDVYFIGGVLKDHINPQEVIKSIHSYLASDGSWTTHRPTKHGLQPPLRPREYWALMLASMEHRELQIATSDTEAERNAIIQKFLSSEQ